MSAQIFSEPSGTTRTCTVLRDVTERVAMERELRELALTDELTGLSNRRGFVTVASHMLAVADREGSSAHVVFVDVDNLKSLNDRYGHKAGDAGLQAVGRALSAGLRRADLVARIGGDEFVALSMGLDESERHSVERRIRKYLRAEATNTLVGASVEVSLGWAAHDPDEPTTIEDLLSSADRAMYQAKAARQRRRLTISS